jgi:hypothetical protein
MRKIIVASFEGIEDGAFNLLFKQVCGELEKLGLDTRLIKEGFRPEIGVGWYGDNCLTHGRLGEHRNGNRFGFQIVEYKIATEFDAFITAVKTRKVERAILHFTGITGKAFEIISARIKSELKGVNLGVFEKFLQKEYPGKGCIQIPLNKSSFLFQNTMFEFVKHCNCPIFDAKTELQDFFDFVRANNGLTDSQNPIV